VLFLVKSGTGTDVTVKAVVQAKNPGLKPDPVLLEDYFMENYMLAIT
jgi:hypothetical protein